MNTRYRTILTCIFFSLILHAAIALQCYNCHYAYEVKKGENKEFTDAYYNERDPSESLRHKDCGENKPPSELLIKCPESEDANCWMGTITSKSIKGVARGCDTIKKKDLKRMKQTMNSCFPTVTVKAKEENPGDEDFEKTNCYCNSTDGCSDWKYPGQKSGESIKRILSGSSTTLTDSGLYKRFLIIIITIIIVLAA